jgi:uncharacterized protein
MLVTPERQSGIEQNMSSQKSKPLPAFMRAADNGIVLALHAQPGARQTRLVGIHGEALKVKIKAPPVDGKANAALIEWLAELFGVNRSQVRLVQGEKNRSKAFEIRGVSPQTAIQIVERELVRNQ